jgi:site-specific recombinase XerD
VDERTEWLAWLRDVRGRSPLTLYTYAGTLDALTEWAGARSLTSLRLKDLESFLARRPAGVNTRHRETATLSSFYGWLYHRGQVRTNPTVMLHSPTIPRREPRPISDQVWAKVWQEQAGHLDRQVALGLGYWCGLRRAEIVSLTPRNVGQGELLHFTRKGMGEDTLPIGVMCDTLGSSSTFLPLLAELAEDAEDEGRHALLPWAKDRTNDTRVHPLEPARIDPQALGRRMRSWGCPFTPHQLRASCATNLARAGMPVQMIQRLLNHADLVTTQRYVRTSNVEIEEWARLRRGFGPHG